MTYKQKVLYSDFINIVEDYMIKDLKINSDIVSDLILKAKNNFCFTEFAHTPSFFHVGNFRSYLTLFQYAIQKNTSKLFCVNDHLDIKAIKEIKAIPFKDLKDNTIQNPPSLAIPKKKQYYSLVKYPSPKYKSILELINRIIELNPRKKSKAIELQNTMLQCSEKSENLSTWFVNLIFCLTKTICLVLPTSKYDDLFELRKKKFDNFADGFLWVHCSICGARLGKQSEKVKICKYCNCVSKKEFFPNVVMRQNLVNQLNIKYRICGKKKKYQSIADQAMYFTKNTPVRVHTNSNTLVNYNNALLTKLNIIQLYILKGSLEKKLPKSRDCDWKISI